VITPTSVAVTGRVVDIELASGATMAVDFVADKLVAAPLETITFTDLTNNSPTEWAWDFNGEGYRRLQNPTFSFFTTGFKDITLFAAKTGLGGFITKTGYIEVVGDPDVIAFFTATGITDPIIEAAITNLVADLKTAGIWTKMKAIYPFVGGTATTHKYNLKDPQDTNAAFRINFFGGIVHDANGVTGNGTNGYFDTNYNDSTQNILNNASAWAYARNNLAINGDTLLSTVDSINNANQINPRNASNAIGTRMQTTTVNSTPNTDSRGLFGLNRITGSNYSVWRNVVKTTINEASTSLQNANILGFWFSFGPVYSLRNMAFMALGEGLSDPEATDLYNAIQTFQTALSRQV
jgi:PKD repeat protein